MPNQNFKRWTADDIAKLKNLAQKHRREYIAVELGRSPCATAIKARQLGLSLKVPAEREKAQGPRP
jgi:hypothetical protein